IPACRHRSLTGTPASPCLRIETIWVSLNFDFFMEPPGWKDARKLYFWGVRDQGELTAGIYQDYVADLFLSVPAEMASELAYEGSSGGYEPTSIATVLDSSLQSGFTVGDKAWDKGDEMAQMGIKSAIAGIGYYALAIL